jgi:hypothetical protein
MPRVADRSNPMRSRDWGLVASGAALATVMVVSLYEGRAMLAHNEPDEGRASAAHRRPDARTSDRRLDEVELALRHTPDTPTSQTGDPAVTDARVASQLEQVRSKLHEVEREKQALNTELRALEGELDARARVPATGDPREFELDKDDWKALAAEGRIKYRIPCQVPADSSYTISQQELDEIGLSPEDGKLLVEARRRSNARVWATLRPLCLAVLGDADAVESIGPTNCLLLIEKDAMKKDALSAMTARQQVAEVHAGMRLPPEPGEKLSPVFEAYMAVTSEAHLFEADLAENFGPEEARRITHSMSCVATVR